MSISFSESISTLGLSSLVSKGDILSSDGTTRSRLPVGTDGKVLTAQSSASLGLSWADGPIASSSYFSLIESSTLTTDTVSYTFSNLPTTYHTFRIILQGKHTATANDTAGRYNYIQINGDTTATNYYISYFYGTSSATYSNTENKGSYSGFYAGTGSSDNHTNNVNYRGIISFDISGASNTSFYKIVRIAAGNGDGPDQQHSVGMWISTSAVTSISVSQQTLNYGPGTYVALYGMK